MNSSGLHVSTGSVELGDAGLDPETANRAEIGLHWHNGPLTLAASLYHVRYADFIYLADTGIAEHDRPLRARTQEDARFSGGEPRDRKSTRLNSSHSCAKRMPSHA